MLILTRRIDESIIIDDRIVITVLGIEGDKVKIGVTAPRDLKIYRNELWQAIHDQEHLAEQLATGLEPASFESLRQLLVEESGEPAVDEQADGSVQEETGETEPDPV